MFVALITMTAGFVLSLAAWFAPPRSDAVLRVRIAGPATLTVGFCILVFSYILCAIEQSRCSNCCYDFIAENEKKYRIKTKNNKLSNSSCAAEYILRNGEQEKVQMPGHDSVRNSMDKVSLLDEHFGRFSSRPDEGYQLMPHDPGVRRYSDINYTYNPMTHMYNLKSPSPAKMTDSQCSMASYQLTSASPMSSISDIEPKSPSKFQIPFIDATSDDISLSAKLENGFSEESLDYYPLKGNIARLPKRYSKPRAKTKRKGEGQRKSAYKSEQYYGQPGQCYFNKTAGNFHGKHTDRHTKDVHNSQYKNLNTSDKFQSNGNNHTSNVNQANNSNTQDSDSDFQLQTLICLCIPYTCCNVINPI